MNLLKSFLLLTCLVIMGTLQAQTKYYLSYDANCMDRYDYHYTNNPTGDAHVAYHIIMNDREKVVLEVGIENRINQGKPKGVRSCSDFRINERMVRKINNGEVQLFIVKKNGNGYNVSEVGLAAYTQISPASISFSSMDGRFAYNYSQPADGSNLATASSSQVSKVYFEGLMNYDCPKKYQFRKQLTGGGENYVAWTVVPEIGVIEKKRGFNATDANNKVLKLKSINNIDITTYLASFCRNVDTDFSSGKFYHLNNANYTTSDNSWEVVDNNSRPATTTTTTTSSYPTTTTTSYPTTTTTTNNTGYVTSYPSTSECQVYKDVNKGKYFIFGTNELANMTCGGNTYRNGMLVGAPTTTVATTSYPSTSTSTNVVYTQPTTSTVTYVPEVTNEVVYTQPEVSYTPPATTTSTYTPCTETATYGYHIVQKDETLYRISKQYDVTVKQLRAWNGLRNNRIYPCKKLRIIKPGGSTSSVAFVEKGPQIKVDYNSKNCIHTVKKGENLYQIATKYGFTVDKLRHMNDLGTSKIVAGQDLRISDCDCAKGSTNAVALNDTKVVAYDNVPREYDNVKREKLTSRGKESVSYSKGKKRRFHLVKEDDTIYYISKKYGISVDKLRTMNDLGKDEVIVPFQRIYLEE